MELEEIHYGFGGWLDLATGFESVICKTLQKFSDKQIEYVQKNVWFITSTIHEWAFTVHKKHIPKYLIFLSSDLKSETKEIQMFSIAHEIAHVLLKHKSPILDTLTEEETKKQEEDADNFVINLGFKESNIKERGMPTYDIEQTIMNFCKEHNLTVTELAERAEKMKSK